MTFEWIVPTIMICIGVGIAGYWFGRGFVRLLEKIR